MRHVAPTVGAMRTPPYRIETERCVIRCYEPADAPRLKECVDSSLPELQVRMPWALEDPQSVDEKVELLRGMRSRFDTDADYTMGVFTPDGSRQLGGTGLHRRGSADSLEIGYFIRTDSVGRGLATHVVGILTDVGLRQCGAHRIQIDVEVDNAASLAIPRRLGYLEEGMLRGRASWPDRDPCDVITFSIVAAEWSAGLADKLRVPSYRAFDAAGREF